jgi:hypothetical protein
VKILRDQSPRPLHRFGWKIVKLVLLIFLLVSFAVVAPGGTLVLPLTRTNGWQFLKYRQIPSNTFHCTSAGLVIGVTNSAAPAVFPLTNELHVVGFSVSGKISGSLNVTPDKQGEKEFDDFTLRLGLVEPGTRTLSWWEKLTAADWVKKLFSLAPPGMGISKIHSYNVGTVAAQIGRSWAYDSDVPMEQTVVAVPDADGHFTFTNRFNQPFKVIAVWISSDGDDTHSLFVVTLKRVEFKTTP